MTFQIQRLCGYHINDEVKCIHKEHYLSNNKNIMIYHKDSIIKVLDAERLSVLECRNASSPIYKIISELKQNSYILEYILGIETQVINNILCYQEDASGIISGSEAKHIFECIPYREISGSKTVQDIWDKLTNIQDIFYIASLTNMYSYLKRFIEKGMVVEKFNNFTVQEFKNYLKNCVNGKITQLHVYAIDLMHTNAPAVDTWINVPFTQNLEFVVDETMFTTCRITPSGNIPVKMKW